MAPVRKGDGTPLAPTDYQQVRKGDGTVLFDAIPDSGISRWTFDNADTSGSTAVDVWGNNDGTINGATTGVTGANQTYNTNEAYSFDGNDDIVDIGTDTFSESQLSAFSVALWVNPDNTGVNEQYFGIEGVVRVRQNSSDEFEFAIFDGDGYAVNAGTVSTNWTHLVGTYDGNEMVLYTNGNQVGSLTGVGTPIVDDLNRRSQFADSYTGDNTFSGSIDDPRLYDKALSSTEVSDLYNTGSI